MVREGESNSFRYPLQLQKSSFEKAKIYPQLHPQEQVVREGFKIDHSLLKNKGK
ncbi:hypothetical protein PROAA_1340021 [Candidatus Propionivibrio aalborgensis]|jgi:hypothetical protein|uniref:Uncharacterized protein n=1 Tax=Candidatus Propionivibrio aalborgensis TaxID=1860101 RepID=A0A1A8XJ38_9RHOO|nr:hypothetical protein PROAA_1340021 [Candidatus Propionivibrio aalborgensis]